MFDALDRAADARVAFAIGDGIVQSGAGVGATGRMR